MAFVNISKNPCSTARRVGLRFLVVDLGKAAGIFNPKSHLERFFLPNGNDRPSFCGGKAPRHDAPTPAIPYHVNVCGVLGGNAGFYPALNPLYFRGKCH
jgi:hypothetical protein